MLAAGGEERKAGRHDAAARRGHTASPQIVLLLPSKREAEIGEPGFHCPIGLPLGTDTPEEIAISIAAEMLQVRGI